MTDRPIIFSPHPLDRMRKRGAAEDEVEKTIRSSPWQEAKHERYEARLNFPYNADWNGKFYRTKQVCPIFIIEEQQILVITVYVFYF